VHTNDQIVFPLLALKGSEDGRGSNYKCIINKKNMITLNIPESEVEGFKSIEGKRSTVVDKEVAYRLCIVSIIR